MAMIDDSALSVIGYDVTVVTKTGEVRCRTLNSIIACKLFSELHSWSVLEHWELSH